MEVRRPPFPLRITKKASASANDDARLSLKLQEDGCG